MCDFPHCLSFEHKKSGCTKHRTTWSNPNKDACSSSRVHYTPLLSVGALSNNPYVIEAFLSDIYELWMHLRPRVYRCFAIWFMEHLYQNNPQWLAPIITHQPGLNCINSGLFWHHFIVVLWCLVRACVGSVGCCFGVRVCSEQYTHT